MMKQFWIGYWFKPWYFLYRIGYAIVISGIRGYFKNHQYDGKENIPSNTGILYAVNHQNAFLDPIVIAGRTKEPTHFLARADIFKKPMVAKILSMIYMLPIYRQRDGVDTIKMNQKTFDTCFDILKNKGNVIIFPEGNHNYKKSLRPLKKGVSRIALGAAEKYNYDIDVKIVVLGLDYENHFKMNGSLYLNAGKPIDVSEYYENHKKNPSETINNLSERIYKTLDSLIINIRDDENYDELYYLLHRVPLKTNSKKVSLKFQLRKERLDKMENLKKTNTSLYEEVISFMSELKITMKKFKLRPYLLHQKPNSLLSLFIYSLLLTLLSPFHIIGLTTNYLPYKTPVWFVNSKVKDKHFHSSLKMALGSLFFYLYWFIITIIFSQFFGWKYGILFFITLPLIAAFNYKYWIYFIKVKGLWNYKLNYKSILSLREKYLNYYAKIK